MTQYMYPSDILRIVGACDMAVRWVERYAEPKQAWLECRRGNWLLWFAAHICVPRRLIAAAVCACARTALTDDDNFRDAMDAVDRLRSGDLDQKEAFAVCEKARSNIATIRDVYTIKAIEQAAKAMTDSVSIADHAAMAACCASMAVALAGHPHAKLGDDLRLFLHHLEVLAAVVRRRIPWSSVEEQIQVALSREGGL